jgi:hypothetical protein
MKNKIPLKFYTEQSSYVVGEGYTTAWLPLKTTVDITGTPQEVSVFWGNWKSAYGKQVYDAQAVGIEEAATVRMTFIPSIYEALRGKQVVISKGAGTILDGGGLPDKDNIEAYTVFGGVDNVGELGKEMEFKVRRYESQ